MLEQDHFVSKHDHLVFHAGLLPLWLPFGVQAAFGFHPGSAVPGPGAPGVPQGAAAAGFLPYGPPPTGSPPLPLNGQMYAPHAFQFQPPIFPPPVPPPPAGTATAMAGTAVMVTV